MNRYRLMGRLGYVVLFTHVFVAVLDLDARFLLAQ